MSDIYGELYHSDHGAITESNHVYIQSGLEYYLDQNTNENIRIFEMGMGTGLNVLLTLLKSSPHLNIKFTTVEAFPITLEQANKLNYISHLQVFDYTSKFKLLHSAPWNMDINITDNFKFCKINSNLVELSLNQKFDIIYYDAFGPKTQPELWDEHIMKKMYDLLSPNGILITYCAMGQFKRDLKKVGFQVESIPGPPGKREITRAIKI